MKKILSVLLIGLLGLGFVSCKSNDDSKVDINEPIISVNKNVTTITVDQVNDFDVTSVFVILDEDFKVVETKKEYIIGTLSATEGTYVLVCTYNGVSETAIITVTGNGGSGNSGGGDTQTTTTSTLNKTSLGINLTDRTYLQADTTYTIDGNSYVGVASYFGATNNTSTPELNALNPLQVKKSSDKTNPTAAFYNSTAISNLSNVAITYYTSYTSLSEVNVYGGSSAKTLGTKITGTKGSSTNTGSTDSSNSNTAIVEFTSTYNLSGYSYFTIAGGDYATYIKEIKVTCGKGSGTQTTTYTVSATSTTTEVFVSDVASLDLKSLFTIKDSNNTNIPVLDSYISGTVGTTVGNYTITCTYQGASKSITVKVKADIVLTASVVANDNKVSKTVSEVANLDLKTLFTVLDKDGNPVTVTDAMINGTVSAEAGSYTITCTYDGVSASCVVKVRADGTEEIIDEVLITKAKMYSTVQEGPQSSTYVDDDTSYKQDGLKMTLVGGAFGFASSSFGSGYYDAGAFQLKKNKENLYTTSALENFTKIEIIYLCTSTSSYTPAQVYYGTAKHPATNYIEGDRSTEVATSYSYKSSSTAAAQTIYSQLVTYTIPTGNSYFTIKNTGSAVNVLSIKVYGTPIVADTSSYTMLTQTSYTTQELTAINNALGTSDYEMPFPTCVNYDIEETELYGYSCVLITFNTTEENMNAFSALMVEEFDIEYDSEYQDYYGEFETFTIDYYFEESEDYDGLYTGTIELYPEDGETGGDDDDDDPVEPTKGTTDLVDDGNGYQQVAFNTQTVKNVHDISDYEGGCPTTGDVKVLVIPVDFSDCTATNKGYTIDKINAVFNGPSTDDNYLYYSVKEYMNQSSYGQLNITFDIYDSWFRASKASTYYENMYKGTSGTLPADIYGQTGEDSYVSAEQIILNEALSYLDTNKGYDLSDYDSDNNGSIDAVVLVYSCDIDESDDSFFWAWRYWNLLATSSSSQEYYYYDNVNANDYLWVSYQFIFETEDGESFNSNNTINTYTFIHEFSHVLGADDYYDYAGKNNPMEGLDVMDYTVGDHNMYTKMWLGWVTNGKVITTADTVTLTLTSSATTQDFYILCNTYDTSKGLFQEYYIVEYYSNTGNNTKIGGYYDKEGIVVHHVNSTCTKETDEYGDYYVMDYNNNDKSYQYGTKNNLIELVKGGSDFIFTANESLGQQVLDDNTTLCFDFTVDSIASGVATITFSRIK